MSGDQLDLDATPGDVAQSLIDTAARTKDIAARSALLAASRVVDALTLENLRLRESVASLDAELRGADWP